MEFSCFTCKVFPNNWTTLKWKTKQIDQFCHSFFFALYMYIVYISESKQPTCKDILYKVCLKSDGVHFTCSVHVDQKGMYIVQCKLYNRKRVRFYWPTSTCTQEALSDTSFYILIKTPQKSCSTRCSNISHNLSIKYINVHLLYIKQDRNLITQFK